MDILLASPWAAPGWADVVTLHTSGAAETTSGVLRYVARALACFSHERVVEVCCPDPGDELDIERLLLENGTLYLLGKGSRLGDRRSPHNSLGRRGFRLRRKAGHTDAQPSSGPTTSGFAGRGPEYRSGSRAARVAGRRARSGDRDRLRHAVILTGRYPVGRPKSANYGYGHDYYGRPRWPNLSGRPGRLGKGLRPASRAAGNGPSNNWWPPEPRPIADNQLGGRDGATRRSNPHAPGWGGARALVEVAPVLGLSAASF